MKRRGAEEEAVTKILLIRHGETDWNVIHRLQGITDTHLTDTGVLQAKRVASRLAKVNPMHKIYSSDLSRALNTAKEIAHARNEGVDYTIQLDPRLREFDLGIFAGHNHVSQSI
jgi:broad specificity phosphatase PhoE